MKVGDKVRYVKAGPIGWESMDWAERAGCAIGSLYKVAVVDLDDMCPSISLAGKRAEHYLIHPDHFEVVKDGKE